MKTFLPLSLALFLGAHPLLAADPEPTAEQLNFFEKKIRPVLVDKCYKCHSEKSEKIKGGLVLDTREGIRRGGDNGPGVVPGSLDDSLLVEALRYQNKDFAMPPEKSGGKLAEEVIKDFEAWIKMGAPDPRKGPAKVVKKHDAEEARKWWAFQPVTPMTPPAGTPWARTEVDRFIEAGLESKGLKPVADADKSTLIRRAYFDLIGLPPTPAEIDAFLKDFSPDAFAKVIDRLLASPQFGERWGRHWLDVARFAESSGKDVNLAFPTAWRYRDYVVAAFNADKPYNQFVKEQIAGDLLPARNDQERAEHLVATGFLALGPKGLNEQNPRQFALDLADEQIDTVSQAVLGLTIACARCHDHKFDPVPQREYYALAGVFLSTDTRYGTARGIQNRHSTDLLELPKGAGASVLGRTLSREDRQRKEKQLEQLRTEQRELAADRLGQRRGKEPEAKGRPGQNAQQRLLFLVTQIGALEAELKLYDEEGHARALAMGARDLPTSAADRGEKGGGGFQQMFANRMRERFGGRPPEFSIIGDSALYARGEVDKPGEKVPRAFPAIFNAGAASIPEGNSGRLQLAEALTAPSNPLTSRVMANRVWHWLFGAGIVTSTDNFGTTGAKPSNSALLDFLAQRLSQNGWSIKKLIRELVLSRTYQLASTYDERSFGLDPENALHWRMSKKRLDAECIRDAILSVSGQLDLKLPLASLIAEEGDGPIGGPPFRGIPEAKIVDAASNHRSLYLPIARDVLPDALAAFDFAESSLVTGARETTNVPAQALYLLNSSFVSQQAEKTAERLLAAYPGGPNAGVAANLDQRVLYAYWLAVARPPDPVERQAAANFFSRFPSNWAKGDKAAAGMRDSGDVKAAWTSFCRALFASAEFRFLN